MRAAAITSSPKMSPHRLPPATPGPTSKVFYKARGLAAAGRSRRLHYLSTTPDDLGGPGWTPLASTDVTLRIHGLDQLAHRQSPERTRDFEFISSILASPKLSNRSASSLFTVEKKLHHGVVAIAAATHASGDTTLAEDRLVVLVRVGAALVGVVQESASGQRRCSATSSALIVSQQ
jgi:hypothetical protein